jgi:hypothetical protein
MDISENELNESENDERIEQDPQRITIAGAAPNKEIAPSFQC